jgi:hypothetical protein
MNNLLSQFQKSNLDQGSWQTLLVGANRKAFEAIALDMAPHMSAAFSL